MLKWLANVIPKPLVRKVRSTLWFILGGRPDNSDAVIYCNQFAEILDQRMANAESMFVRSLGALEGRVADMESRRSDLDEDYEEFLRLFGETDERFLRKYQSLISDLRPADALLELGCGRGRFLQLLKDCGLEAIGVESDPEMVNQCRSVGLSVAEAGDREFLERTESGVVNGIFLFHRVDHLPCRSVRGLFEEGLRVLKPGGFLVLETVDFPLSVEIGRSAMDFDGGRISRRSDLYSFLLEKAGFLNVDIRMVGEGITAEERSPEHRAQECLPNGTPGHEVVQTADTIAGKRTCPNDRALVPAQIRLKATKGN